MIKRGVPNNPRKHARNYIQKQAQKRLDETVQAFNHQVENSLAVDAVEIELYQIQLQVGAPCSCSKTHKDVSAFIDDDDNGFSPTMIPHKEHRRDGINIQFQDDDIFGDGMAEKVLNDAVSTFDVSGDDAIVGTLEADDEIEFTDGLLSGSINCGICYRSTLVPGFKAYGRQRTLFTHHNVENLRGVFLDSTQSPHCFVRQHDDGFASFLLPVPKFFKSVTVSIRDNIQVLNERPHVANGALLSISDLRRHAGRDIEIFIKVDSFTHVVFDFDMGVEKIRANISGENIALDYDRLTTLSDMTVVLGPSVSDVNPGDIICIPKRNLVLKVRDKERKITASQRRLEWVVQTRVLQPTEPLKQIAKGYKLL